MRVMKSARIGPRSSVSRFNGGKDSLFYTGKKLREFRILLDMDSTEITKYSDHIQYLLGLLAQDSIVCARYSDKGPPPSVPRVNEEGVGNAAIGWIETHSLPDNDVESFTYGEAQSISFHGLRLGDWIRIARDDRETVAYRSLTNVEASGKREAAMRLLAIAEQFEADLLISDREYLLAKPDFIARRGVEILTASDALPVIGLYLRTRDDYVLSSSHHGKVKYTFNKGLLYWVAARALLPEGWRWMSGCVHHGIKTDDMLTHYAGTAHERLDRALRSRDMLFLALNQPQNNDTADDALIAFDNILISLSAAMDVVARVMNYTLGSLTPAYHVGWKRTRWIEKLQDKLPAAAALTEEKAYGHLLTIVGELRNTIHGAALQPLAVSESALLRSDTLVGLPSENLEKLLHAMDATGGRESWGVQETIPGRAHAELDVICERLMEWVPQFLNEAMRLTPVEQLEHANLKPENCRPPEEARSPFREQNRRSILWQLGLKEVTK